MNCFLAKVVGTDWVVGDQLGVHTPVKESEHTTCVNPHDFVSLEALWTRLELVHQAIHGFASVDSVENDSGFGKGRDAEIPEISR